MTCCGIEPQSHRTLANIIMSIYWYIYIYIYIAIALSKSSRRHYMSTHIVIYTFVPLSSGTGKCFINIWHLIEGGSGFSYISVTTRNRCRWLFMSISQSNALKENAYIDWIIVFNMWMCRWCNCYRRRKWTRRHEIKSWTRLIAFQIALIPLGNVWIQLFSLQLWVNSMTD